MENLKCYLLAKENGFLFNFKDNHENKVLRLSDLLQASQFVAFFVNEEDADKAVHLYEQNCYDLFLVEVDAQSICSYLGSGCFADVKIKRSKYIKSYSVKGAEVFVKNENRRNNE